MNIKSLVLLTLGGTHTWAASTGSSGSAKRQSTTAKYCPGGTQICFSEFKEPVSGIYYRIAIPEVSAAPFDVLLQIVAPIDKAGWAGVAWGGKMNGNPLTVAWPNGDSAVVSSRWSTWVTPILRALLFELTMTSKEGGLCLAHIQGPPTPSCRQPTRMQPTGSSMFSVPDAVSGKADLLTRTASTASPGPRTPGRSTRPAATRVHSHTTTEGVSLTTILALPKFPRVSLTR